MHPSDVCSRTGFAGGPISTDNDEIRPRGYGSKVRSACGSSIKSVPVRRAAERAPLGFKWRITRCATRWMTAIYSGEAMGFPGAILGYVNPRSTAI